MDVTANLEAPCSPEALFQLVSDLGTYPKWLDIVPRAVADGDVEPAWIVDLRGKLGPFARSKRLRMVRTTNDAPTAVVFERKERDGRSHSDWRLSADVSGTADGSRLTMRLHYGGGLWGPILERLLTDEIERSKPRLLELVSGASEG
ncbi:MAG TPA: SRPBCC family protein [Acidimicrobiales bacterium]|nr:SRPBCC family protein [Acidimicrobiales bacterium]